MEWVDFFELTHKKVDSVVTTGIFHLIILNTGSGLLWYPISSTAVNGYWRVSEAGNVKIHVEGLYSKIHTINVKTVKKQTFHERSTNVPISNGNETKTFEFVPEFVLSKENISIFVQESRFLK